MPICTSTRSSFAATFWEWPTISPTPGHCSTRIARRFRELLTASAASRNLPGAMLIDKDRNILETAQTGIQQSFTTPAPEFLSNVDENEPQIAVFIEANYGRGGDPAPRVQRYVLVCARLLDPRVVAQLRQNPGERRRICPAGSPPARDSGGVRADVCGDRADQS